MNQYKRNVVIVGLNEKEKAKLFFKDIRELKDEWKDDDYTHRFPHVIFEDTLEDGLKHQGFLLIVKMDLANDNYLEYDIKNRHKFKMFYKAYLYDENIKTPPINMYNRYKKIRFVDSYNLFYNVSQSFLEREYEEYIENEKRISKMTKKRKNNIEKLNKYLKGKKNVTREQIEKDLNVSRKWVIRYMNDLFITHQNIGLITHNKEWYTTD